MSTVDPWNLSGRLLYNRSKTLRRGQYHCPCEDELGLNETPTQVATDETTRTHKVVCLRCGRVLREVDEKAPPANAWL